VELFLNGKSLGKKTMQRNSHLQWQVNYEPGVLEAVAFKKAKKLTAKIETTGEPYELVINSSKTTMLADGRDATVVNISAVDKQGREVPDANNLINFSLTGDARIVGVGNGDPSSHEQDKCENGAWQRHLFNGKCQVIIQAGNHENTLKFDAKSEDLQADSITIFTVPVASSHPAKKEL
jgi:beta-galactosidase